MGVRTLVKVSGSLLQHIRVFQQLKEMNQHHHLTICVGGGEQINDAFTARGNPITFGPFDRVCRCEGERELVEKVLQDNARRFRGELSAYGIEANVFIPIFKKEVAGILCNVNADWLPIVFYDNFDEFQVFTLTKNVESKRLFYRDIWQRCGGEGYPEKISVVGFDP